MSKLNERLKQDRELRDAARAVLLADIDHARNSFSAKGVANRVGSRIGDGAVDVFETAKAQAGDNRGIIAALIGAVLLWLGREPILAALGLGEESGNEPLEPAAEETSENGEETPGGDDNEQ